MKAKGVWLIVLLSASPVLAFGPLGPPCARHFDATPDRHWGVGVEIGSGEVDDLDISTWLQGGNRPNVDLDLSGWFIRGEYAEKTWAIFGRLGIGEVEVKDTDVCSLISLLDSGDGALIGGGGRWTFCQNNRYKLGSIVQALYFAPDLDEETGKVGRVTATVGGELTYFAIEAAFGPTVRLTESGGLVAYGGPFVGWRSVDLKVDVRMPLNKFTASEGGREFYFGFYAGLLGAVTKTVYVFPEIRWEDKASFYLSGLWKVR